MNILIKDVLALLPGDKGPKAEMTSVAISGSTIAHVGNVPEDFVADKVIDGKDKLLIPGLINAHTHTYMSFMRNCADDLSFADWLFNTIDPIESKMESEDAYWGSLLGQMEMIKSGTTCFNDQQMHIRQTTRAVKESGMRAVICRGLVGSDYDLDDRRLKETYEDMEYIKDCDRLTYFLGPHAPYSCGPEYLRMVADIARERGMGIHIHLAESLTESENIMKDHGCTPIEYAFKAGVFDSRTIAAHCVNLTESDMDLLAKTNVSVVTNPASNMKLGNGIAPVPEMMAKGINVCLGTDGAASNNSQNLFHELRLLSLIHKGTHKTPLCISAGEAFDMATINGARALGLDTGAIEEGRKADLALLDLNTPSMMPVNNPIAGLSYSADGSETDTVIIDGQIVMENRELKTIDEEKVYYNVRKICERLGL